jgi:hypothetical protein
MQESARQTRFTAKFSTIFNALILLKIFFITLDSSRTASTFIMDRHEDVVFTRTKAHIKKQQCINIDNNNQN